MANNVVSYSLSVNNFGDGKSVCLWRTTDNYMVKIARFQCDASARAFAEDFDFPLSDNVKERLYGQR